MKGEISLFKDTNRRYLMDKFIFHSPYTCNLSLTINTFFLVYKDEKDENGKTQMHV